MALDKTFLTPQGVPVQYSRLLKMEVSAEEKAITYVIGMWVSKEAREAGYKPVWHEYIRVPFEEVEAKGDENPLKTAYLSLMALDDTIMSGASEV